MINIKQKNLVARQDKLSISYIATSPDRATNLLASLPPAKKRDEGNTSGADNHVGAGEDGRRLNSQKAIWTFSRWNFE